MVPLRRAKPIDDREWDRHKARIVELYENGTLRSVIDTMTQEGFTATVSQYEAKFREWKINKYVTRRAITQNDQTTRVARSRRIRRNATRLPREAESGPRPPLIGFESDTGMPSTESAFEAATTTPGAETQCIAPSQNMQPSGGGDNFDHGFDFMTFVRFTPPVSEPASPATGPAPLVAGPNDLGWSPAPGFYSLDWLPALEPNSFTGNITPIPSGDLSLSKQRNWVRPLTSIQVGVKIIKNTYSESLATTIPNNLTRTNAFNFLYEFSNSMTSFRSFKPIQIPSHLYSEVVITGEDWTQLSKIPEAVAPEARFGVRLIASVINRFAGLENMSRARVLNFLQRNDGTRAAVLEYLDTESSPVAKSFAEQIFSASVESDNLLVVIFLLKKKLVDANKAVCYINGRKSTPLETAAFNQSFSVVKYLVSHVDVNKSFSRNDSCEALQLLIFHVAHRWSTLDESFIQLVDAFLEAGAMVSMILIRTVLENIVDARLASRLLKSIAAQTPHELPSQKNLLQDVVKYLEERDATEITEFIINEYRKPGREIYSDQFHHQAHDAFGKAVERRYHQLRGGTKGSDLFISALKSNDQDVLRYLEERGVFDHLRGHKLGLALTEALRAGNEEYANKILDLDPGFTFHGASTYGLEDSQIFNMSTALRAALARDFDDIAWKLLDFGVTAIPILFRKPRLASLLYVAVETKKPDFARAIIDSGFDPCILHDHEWPILEVALESDQDSIFEDLWKARSQFYPTERLLKLALEKGRQDLFLDIVKSGPQCEDWMSRSLQIALECGAKSLLDELISLGAKVDDDRVLEKVIYKYPSTAKLLLDRYWKSYPQGRAGYGHSIISNALRGYLREKGCLSVNMLFTWNLINRNHLRQEHPSQKSLLVKAIETHNFKIVEKFIDAGSEVNSIMDNNTSWYISRDCYKTTALLEAIESNIVRMVQLLVDRGAKANQPARLGIRWTPLQKATERGGVSVVNLLLGHGADVNSVPGMYYGATALQLAAIHGNCEMARILIEHGARNDIRPPRGTYGRWPLEGAAENGRFDMIELLWDAFAPFPDEQCQSALRRAEDNGHFGCKERIEELMAGSSAPNNMFPTTLQIT
ncbi:hypothetical protein GGR58DRAFT_505105 [Xylaria digitata]|nr:hypothetical protein GGR58DRAFT_505105 [Xylaria digitata]